MNKRNLFKIYNKATRKISFDVAVLPLLQILETFRISVSWFIINFENPDKHLFAKTVNYFRKKLILHNWQGSE